MRIEREAGRKAQRVFIPLLVKLTNERRPRKPAKFKPIVCLVESQPPPNHEMTPAQQARVMAEFAQASAAYISKMERIKEAAKEQSRKQALTDKEEIRKAAAGMDADDIKAGRPAAPNRYQLLKPKG